MPKHKRVFNVEWLNAPEFVKWLSRAGHPSKVKCHICEIEFDISNMGISALRSHADGKKHKCRAFLFKPAAASSLVSSASPGKVEHASSSPNIDGWAQCELVLI